MRLAAIPMPPSPTDTPNRTISSEIVTHLEGAVGRGPAEARTIIDRDLVLVILQETLTRTEQTLAAQDEIDLVRETRRVVHDSLDDVLVAIVERETGSKVRVSLSDYSVFPDYAFEALLLESPVSFAEEPEKDSRREEQKAAAARKMTEIYKQYVGRGPAYVKAYLGDDVVAVLLANTLTRAELALAEGDDAEQIRRLRREFQKVIETDMRSMIESTFGRPVKAFLSDHSVYPDYALETFVLE